MKQIIHIHGWETFGNDEDFYKAVAKREYKPFEEKKKWIKRAAEQLTGEYEIFAPDMPCYKNAKYRAWKIWFEKIFPFLNDEELVITGKSLWSTFLAKYLSENTFPKRISQLHLVAWCFDEQDLPEGEDDLADFVFDPAGLKNLEGQVDHIFLYHSKDDTVVPFSHLGKFQSYLPKAMVSVFEDRGHFTQAEFPELLENIRAYKK